MGKTHSPPSVTRHPSRVGLAAAALVAVATAAAAPPPAPPPVAPTAEQRALLQKSQRFMERLARLAPDRRIAVEIRPGATPRGLVVIKSTLTSSDPRFNQEQALLVTEDGRWAFLGRALALPPNTDPHGPKGPETLSALFSRQSGFPVSVAFEKEKGPLGSTLARVVRTLPAGTVQTGGALTADGRWFLMGSFLTLDGDPRAERTRRLSLEDNPSMGPAGAPVSLVVLADYSCSVCAEVNPLFERMVARYPGKVRLIHVDIPHFQTHAWSLVAAVWARCLARVAPEAYWPFTAALFAQQQSFTDENLVPALQGITAGLGVDPRAVGACGNDGAGQRDVLEDMGCAMDLDLFGTPIALVNGTLVDRGFETLLEPAIEEALKSPPKKPAKT